MADRHRLTEKLIRSAEERSRKYYLFDSELLGFSVAINPSGLRAFCLHYWVQGRQRKLTIGRWPEWTVVAARERAKALRREIDAGEDPMARREEQRAAPRIPDLIDLYIEQHLPRLSPRNASDQVSMLRNLVEPEWKTRLVADITPGDVARLLTKIAEGRARPAKQEAKSRGRRKMHGPKPTPIRANRLGEVLRKRGVQSRVQPPLRLCVGRLDRSRQKSGVRPPFRMLSSRAGRFRHWSEGPVGSASDIARRNQSLWN